MFCWHAEDGKRFIVVTRRGLGQFRRSGRSSMLLGRGRPVKILSMRNTVFDTSAREKIGSDVGWESGKHGAFLAPFPNKTGVTVVIPNPNSDDGAFSATDGHSHHAVRVVSERTTTGDRT